MRKLSEQRSEFFCEKCAVQLLVTPKEWRQHQQSHRWNGRRYIRKFGVK